MRILIVAAAVCGLLLVILGASTGHNSSPPAGDPGLVMTWMIQETGRRDLLNTILLFGFVHTLAALGGAALPLRGALALASGCAFLAGVVLFSGGLTIRMLLGEQSGAANAFVLLVPIGGVAFMVGWVLLIAAALMKRRES